METLIKCFLFKSHLKKIKVHCLGDAMIDEYYDVDVNRISPEHPVPVVLSNKEPTKMPGGAANVAYQFKHTNTDVKLISFYDSEATAFFYQLGLDPFFCFIESKLPVKKRFIQREFQVGARFDVEFDNCKLDNEQSKKFHEEVRDYLKKFDKPHLVILSDYNKGFFNSETNYIDQFRDSITLVDPKSHGLGKWKNCTIFKPNSKEAFDLSGLTDWKDQCDFFKKELNCKVVIITNAGNGVRGLCDSGYFEYSFSSNSSVESVIGAGDCFAAFLGLAFAHGFTAEESAKIAYHAGLVYVRQKFNRPIVLAELMPNKIVEPFDLIKRDFDLAFTNGCFDILHKGHLETIRFAKSKAKKVVVAANSDTSVKYNKGNSRPIVPLEHRIAVLSSLEMVDFVTVFHEPTPIDTIKKIRPDYLIKGGDYQADNVIGKEYVKEVFIAPFIGNYSSSNFIK